MGIYMIHPFFINKLMKIHFFYEYPVFMVPILFVLCLIIVEIALRIPVIKRFFKL
jgi:surface polysaccharide O-acyltransferase-like enzyme